MPTNNLIFYSTSFTASAPTNITDGEYDNNLQFSTVTKTLKLPNTNHRSHRFSISNLSGDYDYGSISFSTPNNSTIGVKSSNDKLYLAQIQDSTIELIFKDNEGFNSSNYTIDVITNGEEEGKTQYLNIHVSLAHKKQKPSSNTTITLTNICDHTTIYSYTTGVHVYSPYDARAGSSTLTTKLYSFTPIDNWVNDTFLFSQPFCNQPALPYWYGYGSKVYRVGGEWSRSYGLQDYIVTRKKRFRKPKTKQYTRGPLETYNTVNETSESCIEPVFKDTGLIKKIELNSNLNAPQQYRYYLGYDPSNKRNSNDSVFKALSFDKNKSYPITGFQHALNKLPRGMISALYEGVRINLFPLVLVGAVGAGVAAVGTSTIVSAGTQVVAFFDALIGPLLPTWLQGGLGAAIGNAIATALPWLLLAAALLYLFLNLFKKFTKTYKEQCDLFLHHFTSTPYLNIGDELYRDEDLSQANTGYYCDGAFYYYQTGGSITSKTLSSTYAYIKDDPFTQEYRYSPNPISPSLVTQFPKLMFLPYTSGKPAAHCGGDNVFYSTEFSETLNADCCDMQNGASQTILLPASASTDCFSVANANIEAEEVFSASLETVRASLETNYGSNIDDEFIGEFDADFTHELKIETNPTQVGLFWDNRSGSISVGTPLYYDPQGCQKVLAGWYATGSISAHRTFYRVDGGYVTGISTQSTPLSTSTNDGKPISTSNLDYTSNWFAKNVNKTSLTFISNNLYNISTFDPNSIYDNPSIIAGYYLSESLQDFREYSSFNSITGVVNTSSLPVEAESGWYLPLNDWIDSDDIFQYQDTLFEFTCSIQGDTPEDVCPFVLSDLSSSYFHNGALSNPVLGDRIYRTTGSNLKDLWTYKAEEGYYKIDSDDIIYVNDEGIINLTRACTGEESTPPPSIDLSAITLKYTSSVFQARAACNVLGSSTYYISGSFTLGMHSLYMDSEGLIEAPSGQYSDGTYYRIALEDFDGGSVFTSLQNCTQNILSSSILSIDSYESLACNSIPSQRYWYSGGSNWHNSSNLYSLTGSDGEGSIQAYGWVSDGFAVRERTLSGWQGSTQICSGGGPSFEP